MNNTNSAAVTRRPPPPELIAAVAVDGCVLSRAIGYDYAAFSAGVLRQVEGTLAARLAAATLLAQQQAASATAAVAAPVDPSARPVVRTPATGRVFFVNEPVAAAAAPNSSEIVRIAHASFVESLATRGGWNVLHPAAKAPDASDTEMKAAIAPLLAPHFFDGSGIDLSKKTATDVVVVLAGANDHVPLLRAISKLLQQQQQQTRLWCFATREARTPDLEEWGRETGRLVDLRLPRTVTAIAAAATSASGAAAAGAAAAAAAQQPEQQHQQRAACANFEDCRNPRCLLRHDPDKRPRVCAQQLECVDAGCARLHLGLHVRGIKGGPVPANQLAPTEGKKRALVSGWALALCPSGAGATCPHGERCRALHFARESEAMERANTGALLADLPPDHVLVDNVPVRVGRLELTEGLKAAVSSAGRAGAACGEQAQCALGDKCPKIHFAAAKAGGSSRAGSSDLSAGGGMGMGMRTASSSDYATPANAANTVISGGAHMMLGAPSSMASATEACCVCADEFALAFGVQCCDAGHFSCEDCLTSYITLSWPAVDFDPGTVPFLRCPQAGCVCVLTDVQVARHCSEEALKLYLDRRQEARDALTHAQAMQNAADTIRRAAALAQATAPAATAAGGGGGASAAAASAAAAAAAEIDLEILKQQLRGVVGATAVQCPQCGCGPISVMGCDDMDAHHGEEHSGGARTKNECPACHFHGHQRSEWLRWDGVPRTGGDPAAWQADNTAMRVAARNDDEMYNSDGEYDEEGGVPLWEEDEDTRRARRRRRRERDREHRRQQRYGAHGGVQAMVPGCGAWLSAQSGTNTHILYHSSGSVQLVFQRDAQGWLFAVRSPKHRQQTYYDGGFAVDGTENRGVAMELNRNYREEFPARHNEPASFFDNSVLVSMVAAPGTAASNGSSDEQQQQQALWSVVMTQKGNFTLLLCPTKVVVPALGITIDADCSTEWFMFSPLMVKDFKAGKRPGADGFGPNGDAPDGGLGSNNDGDDDDDDDDTYEQVEAEDLMLGQNLVLVHCSGRISIALNVGSNGWFSFKEPADGGEFTAFQAGDVRPQETPVLAPRLRPDVPARLVPVARFAGFGQWRIESHRVVFGRGAAIELRPTGFDYVRRAHHIPGNYNPAMDPQRLDAACEAAAAAIAARLTASAAASSAGPSTALNAAGPPQPKKITPPPPIVRTAVDDDEMALIMAIAEGKQSYASRAREVLTRFRNGDDAASYMMYAIDLKLDVMDGDSFAAFERAKQRDAHAAAAPASAASASAVGPAPAQQPGPAPPPAPPAGRAVGHNGNDGDDDDTGSRGNNNNNGAGGGVLGSLFDNNGRDHRGGGGAPTTGGTASSGAPPSPEMIDLVCGFTGQNEMTSAFALRHFGNNSETAVNYIFWCLEGSRDMLASDSVMGFRRVINRGAR